MVSQAHIARASGLSRQTVSFALNDRLRGRLNPKTCQLVLDTARQLGYVPHQAARRLVRSRATAVRGFDQVGLIYLGEHPAGLDVTALDMLRGAEQELSQLHANLVFVRASEHTDWHKVDRLAASRGVDGWLVIGSAMNDALVARLGEGDLPFVVVGDHRCTRPIHSVDIDNRAAGRLAVEHLAALGHRRAAYIGGNIRYPYQQQILEGWRAALREYGMDQDPGLITDHSIWYAQDVASQSQRLTRFLFQQPDRPATALFFPELGGAVSAYRMLEDARIPVPAQVSIMALEPGSAQEGIRDFARIVVPMAELGRRGVQLLHDIGSEQNPEPRRVLVTPQFASGSSTAPPPSTSFPSTSPTSSISEEHQP